MVLLVDHHADLLARIDDHAAGAFGVGVFAADELPLDEELAVDLLQRADVDVDQLAGELGRRRAAFRSRSRRIWPISARSVSVARAMNGKSARLRARRMRLRDDDVGLRAGAAQPFAARLGQFVEVHEVPAICPGPHRWVRARERACHYDLVGSRAGSILRISSRSFEARSYSSAAMASFISRRSTINCVCCSALLGAALRHLADVPRLAVDVQEQRLQLRGEADVVVRAAEPALLAELQERDAAHRAGPLVEPGQLLGRLADGQMLGQQAGHRRQRFGRLVRRRAPGTCARIPRTDAARSACRRPDR